jgi:hypothetical protein
MRIQDALAAQASAAPFSGAVDAGPLANGIAAQPSSLPDDARAVIQCPAPSVMNGGRRRATEWVLTFEPRAHPFIEPLMGWTGSADPLSQVRLRFSSREAAIGYARRQGLPYEVREPTHIRRGDLAQSQRIAPAVEDPVPPEIGWMWDTPELVLDRLVAANGVGARAA